MAIQIMKCLTLSVILLVMGCANKPVTHHYYLIEGPVSDTVINSNQQIVLYPIELSDYLRSISLHVKSDSGEILYSATDSWAEQPDKMLWRAIRQNLEKHTGHHVLTSFEASSDCAQIKIRINELSPNTTGQVVSNGRWFISTENKILKTNTFSFTGNINVDGYSASNQIFADHLNALSAELNEQIRQLGLCQK